MYNSDYTNTDSQASFNFNSTKGTPEQNHRHQTNHKHYVVRHMYDRILADLRIEVLPYVEVGYDAQQIKAELRKLGNMTVSLNNIETVISTILGEQV